MNEELLVEATIERAGVWDERFLSTYGPLHPRLRELFSDDSNCQLPDIEEEDVNQDFPALD